jgi:ankyrin repeat protein
MKYIKLFEEFDPYEYMMMSPNKKAELIIDKIIKGEKLDYDFIKNLIELGANLEYFVETTGETVLHLVCELTQDVKLVEILLDYGVSPNIQDENGFTPLFSVANNLNGINIANLLLERGAYINSNTNYTGCTPLHMASENANFPVAETFLFFGANPNATDKEDNTPLHYVLERESEKVAELLLEYGADPTLKNVDGKSPLDLAKFAHDKSIIDLFKNFVHMK